MKPDPPPADPLAPDAPGSAIDALLARLGEELRGAIGRRFLWQIAAALGLVLWLGILLDRLFEPSASIRLGVAVTLLGCLLGWLAWVIAPRLWRRIGERDLLTLLHHDHPTEADLMATALDLRSQSSPPNPELASKTITAADRAARSLKDVRLDRRPATMGSAWFAAVALGGALLLGIARPDLVQCFASRMALSERPWPRRVELVAEGFTFDEGSGEWSLIAPRGEPLEFSIRATTSPEHALPRTVWARGAAGGRRGLSTLTRVGQPIVNDTKQQRFRRRIERLDADQTLTVTGGDARLRLRVVAAERPRLVETRIACQPPAYLNAPAFTVESTTLTPLPEGSVVTLSAMATKPLASIEAMLISQTTPQPVDATIDDRGRSISLKPPRLDGSCVVTISVVDTDGLSSEPIDLPLESTPDTPPTVRLTLNGVGRAITRDARLPVLAAVDDDHDISGVELRISREASEPITLEMAAPIALPGDATGGADLLTLRSAGADKCLSVEPGDRLTLHAVAADRYDLAERPPTVSQAVVLEVVTAAELLARLGEAQRELRRGVDALLSDVERLVYELDLTQRRFVGGEPPTQEDLWRWASERALDTRKASDGIAGVADRADGLRRQLVNNRLDQPAMIDRLATAVIGPLRRVIDRDLMTTRQRLAETEPAAVGEALADSLASAQRAAETLERVAASLDSQQTYNEVVSLLRGLIREQRTVNERTAREEAEDARSLLLD